MSRGARGPGAWSKCRHTARSSPGLPQSAAQELAAPPLSLRSAVSEGYGPAVLRARFHQMWRGGAKRADPNALNHAWVPTENTRGNVSVSV